MKTLLTALFLVAGLAVFPAAAESPVVVDVPFAFYAGDRLMPAGEYVLGPLGDSTFDTLLMAAASGDRLIVGNIFTTASRKKVGTRVVFNKYPGERYFLAQTWVEGEPLGREMRKSQRERQVVTTTLITSLKPETVTLLARVK
ncbi:MAG: hypothetical protein IPM24_04285 [Bryobacterales bacterium]|nr:hypothetical protein [Bryobacterales bacterium]